MTLESSPTECIKSEWICWSETLILELGTNTLLFSAKSKKKGGKYRLRLEDKGHAIGFQSIADKTTNSYFYQSGLSKLWIICVVLEENCGSLNVVDRELTFPSSSQRDQYWKDKKKKKLSEKYLLQYILSYLQDTCCDSVC